MRIASAERAVGNLRSWAQRPRWQEECARTFADHFAPVCEQARLSPEGLARVLGDEFYTMAAGVAFEDFLTRLTGPKRRNIIDDYLNARASEEPPDSRDYLRALRESAISFYEVADLNPGRTLFLRDLIAGGEPIEVDERAGSLSAVRWDRMAARVLTINGERCLSGTVLHFPHEAAEQVQRIFQAPAQPAREVESGATLDSADAELMSEAKAPENRAKVLTRIWLSYTLNRLRAPLPVLTNFDGEEIIFVKVRFPVADENREAIARILDGTVFLTRAGDDTWTWNQAGNRRIAVTPKDAVSFVSRDQDGSPSLGQLELHKGSLLLEVNSKQRAERGVEMVTDCLGDLVGTPTKRMRTITNPPAERAEAPRRGTSKIPPELAAMAERELYDRHYHALMDEPVPALGNISPRAAGTVPGGQEKVISLLKFLENSENHRARDKREAPYDFTWMWRELGVLEHRR